MLQEEGWGGGKSIGAARQNVECFLICKSLSLKVSANWTNVSVIHQWI